VRGSRTQGLQLLSYVQSSCAVSSEESEQAEAEACGHRHQSSDPRSTQSGWQQAPAESGGDPKQCVVQKGVHPRIWSRSINQQQGLELVTWVEQRPQSEDWLLVNLKAGEEIRLMRLPLGTSIQRPRARHCADFLNGSGCSHLQGWGLK
jgi:hypothetical protein